MKELDERDEEALVLLKEYALEDDDKLTEAALRLKRMLLAIAGKTTTKCKEEMEGLLAWAQLLQGVSTDPIALHDEADRRIKRAFVASFLRAAINQNIERKTLAEELQKKFNEGYAQGKKSLIWDSTKQEAFEHYKKEAAEYRDLLHKLGFPIYLSEAHGRTEKIKERQDLLMKCSNMIQAFDSKSLGWAISSIEGALGNMKQALEDMVQIQQGKLDTPLKT